MVCLLDAVIFLSVDIRRMDDGLRQGIKTERFSKIGWIKGSGSIDRCSVYLPRQLLEISEKVRKIKGCGSLREDFYTRFMTEN